MSAFTGTGRAHSERVLTRDKRPLAANVKAIKGVMAACTTAGYFQPATGGAGEIVVGFFYETIDNTGGAAGAKVADIHFIRERGLVLLANNASAPVTIASRERPISLLDNQTATVATPTAGEGVRCYDVTTEGVWVERF